MWGGGGAIHDGLFESVVAGEALRLLEQPWMLLSDAKGLEWISTVCQSNWWSHHPLPLVGGLEEAPWPSLAMAAK